MNFRSHKLSTFGLLGVLLTTALAENSQNNNDSKNDSKKKNAISRYGAVKYPENFSHFNYANPNAPKGGRLVLGTIGTFDTLNKDDIKGIPAQSLLMTHDPLMQRSMDEPFSLYGLIAQSAEIAPDYSYITFYLNPKATFHDGTPITAQDVEFTFNLLKEKGRPNQRHHYAKIEKVKVLDPHTITFHFKKTADDKYDPELPLIMAVLRPLSKEFFKNHDFLNMGLTTILSSGPYKVGTFKAGQAITFERVKNYWAQDLAVNKGRYNFDQIKIDYYKNKAALNQAFLSGAVDFHAETSPQEWKTNITGPMIHSGKIKKLEITHKMPVTLSTFLFNLRRPIFQDASVRQALSLVLNFDTLNKMAFQNELKRTNSLFANTTLACPPLPTDKEKELLKQYSPPLSDNILSEPVGPKPALTPAEYRASIAKGDTLLKQAGWIIKNGKRVHEKTKQPLTFEFLIKDQALEKVALAYKKNLEMLGIFITVRLVDTVQYEKRTSTHDFDMIVHYSTNSLSPGAEQSYYYSSAMANVEGSSNYMGIQDPVVEKLANALSTSSTYDELTLKVHALDRVLLFNHCYIPFSYNNKYYWAYWTDRVDFKVDPEIGGNVPELGWSKKLS